MAAGKMTEYSPDVFVPLFHNITGVADVLEDYDFNTDTNPEPTAVPTTDVSPDLLGSTMKTKF